MFALLYAAVQLLRDPADWRAMLFLIVVNGALLSLFNWLAARPFGTLDPVGFRVVVWPLYGYALAAALALAAMLVAR